MQERSSWGLGSLFGTKRARSEGHMKRQLVRHSIKRRVVSEGTGAPARKRSSRPRPLALVVATVVTVAVGVAGAATTASAFSDSYTCQSVGLALFNPNGSSAVNVGHAGVNPHPVGR